MTEYEKTTALEMGSYVSSDTGNERSVAFTTSPSPCTLDNTPGTISNRSDDATSHQQRVDEHAIASRQFNSDEQDERPDIGEQNTEPISSDPGTSTTHSRQRRAADDQSDKPAVSGSTAHVPVNATVVYADVSAYNYAVLHEDPDRHQYSIRNEASGKILLPGDSGPLPVSGVTFSTSNVQFRIVDGTGDKLFRDALLNSTLAAADARAIYIRSIEHFHSPVTLELFVDEIVALFGNLPNIFVDNKTSNVFIGHLISKLGSDVISVASHNDLITTATVLQMYNMLPKKDKRGLTQRFLGVLTPDQVNMYIPIEVRAKSLTFGSARELMQNIDRTLLGEILAELAASNPQETHNAYVAKGVYSAVVKSYADFDKLVPTEAQRTHFLEYIKTNINDRELLTVIFTTSGFYTAFGDVLRNNAQLRDDFREFAIPGIIENIDKYITKFEDLKNLSVNTRAKILSGLVADKTLDAPAKLAANHTLFEDMCLKMTSTQAAEIDFDRIKQCDMTTVLTSRTDFRDRVLDEMFGTLAGLQKIIDMMAASKERANLNAAYKKKLNDIAA